MNGGDDSGDENTLKGFYAYKNTFDDETVWLDIPQHSKLPPPSTLSPSV